MAVKYKWSSSKVKAIANAYNSWWTKSAKQAWASYWWSSSSSRSNTSFVDPSVLQDQHMGKSNAEIASKWWGQNATTTSTGWQKVLQALAKNNKVYWTGWYTNYDSNTWLYSKPNSSTTSTSTVSDPASQYSDASYKNYTNAFNKFKLQWMDDVTARSQAAKLLEKEDLLSKNNNEKIAEETKFDDDSWVWDTLDWIFDEGEYTYDEAETPPMNEQTFTWDDVVNYANDLYDDWSSKNLESNTIKETVPEERDTTFDFNTYYNSNVADQTPYEGWQTKDVQQEGLTFAERYEEPITNSLQDLGLLTPNEQAAETMPNTEEQPAQPEAYNSAEDIVNEFNTVLATNPDEQQPMTTMDALRKYQEYKRKLEKFVNDNKLSEEEYNAYLNKIRNNAALQQVLKDNWAQ